MSTLPPLPDFGQCRQFIDDFPSARIQCAENLAAGRRCHDCPKTKQDQLRAYAEAYAEAKVLAERERCADLCEQWDATHPARLAAEIRKRPNAALKAEPPLSGEPRVRAWERESNINGTINGVFQANADGSAPDIELKTERLVPLYRKAERENLTPKTKD